MDFVLCPLSNLGPLTSIARDVCPFPDYSPSPLFTNLLSMDSSLHLSNHYLAVQSSLNPQQLEDFNQKLRTIFGREGKVTLGSVGVVALSLAVLFDTLARQVRGQWESEVGPIPSLFLKNPKGFYPPQVSTVSEYLRLVPYIANNPTQMKEVTKRYFQRLKTDEQSFGFETETPFNREDVTALNVMQSYIFQAFLQIHHARIKNTTEETLIWQNRGIPKGIITTFNCDPEAADEDFLAEVQRADNHTKALLTKVELNAQEIWLKKVAQLEFLDAVIKLSCPFGNLDQITAQREDFDLKANALTKWRE